MKAPVLFLAVGIAMVGPLAGEMVFEKSLVEINAQPDDEVVSAEFRFMVKGKEPVTITEYEAACNCLSAEISDGGKLVWKPGQSGVIRGKFRMGTFKGTVDKHIILRIAGRPRPIKLTVRVNIPVLFDLQPPTLFWELDGNAGPQSFKIAVKRDKPIKIMEITGTNDQFEHELKTIRDGWEYEIVVTPKQVTTRAFGLLRIRTDCEIKKHQTAQGFVVVRRPRPAAPPAAAPAGRPAVR